jgi:hypothetical protein
MLTDEQLQQITEKYGACNHAALQEAARLGVVRAAELAGVYCDLWRDEQAESGDQQIAATEIALDIDEWITAQASVAAQPHTAP